MKIWDSFFYLIEVQGVLVNEGWGFQSNPKVQGGFSEARVGFPIQLNLKEVFWMKKVWLSNPTQDSGV